MKKLEPYSKQIPIAALYFFLFAGGLWHVLGVFQTLMRILAAPLLIALSIIVFVVTLQILRDQKIRLLFLAWAMLVIIGSFAIEWLGVKTGKIFGHYAYGETLQPILFGVPIAIGFAWLCMLLTSTAVMQRILPKISNYHFVIQAISISLLMVLFDIVMEPAAMKLGYWTWLGGSIPIQNFIAWFVISFVFAIIGLRLCLFKVKLPAIVFHAYFAQLVYFGMVILK
jgi:putative membrane protein